MEIKMRVSDMDVYKGDEEVTNMTGEEFVKLCYEEKEDVLKEYFAQSTCTEVGEKIRLLIANGTSRDDLYELITSVLNETYYSLLLALDGEALWVKHK